jgi:hypothetical protein
MMFNSSSDVTVGLGSRSCALNLINLTDKSMWGFLHWFGFYPDSSIYSYQYDVITVSDT